MTGVLEWSGVVGHVFYVPCIPDFLHYCLLSAYAVYCLISGKCVLIKY